MLLRNFILSIVREQMEKHKRSASGNSISSTKDEDRGSKRNISLSGPEKPTWRVNDAPAVAARPPPNKGGIGDIIGRFQQPKEEEEIVAKQYGEDGRPIISERPPMLKSNQQFDPPAPVSRGVGKIVNQFQQGSASSSSLSTSGTGDLVNRMQESSIDTQRIIASKKAAPPPPKPKPCITYYQFKYLATLSSNLTADDFGSGKPSDLKGYSIPLNSFKQEESSSSVDSSRSLKPSEIRAQHESNNNSPKSSQPTSLDSSNNSSKPSVIRANNSLNHSGDSAYNGSTRPLKPSEVRSASNDNLFEQTLQSKKQSPSPPRAKTFNQGSINVNQIAQGLAGVKSKPAPPPPFRKPVSEPVREATEEAPPPPLPGRPVTLDRANGPTLPSRPPIPSRPTAVSDDNNRPPQHSGICIVLTIRNRRQKEYIVRRKEALQCFI
jgi:hypothetical protein